MSRVSLQRLWRREPWTSSGGNLVLVVIVGVIALVALGMAVLFRSAGARRRRGHGAT